MLMVNGLNGKAKRGHAEYTLTNINTPKRGNTEQISGSPIIFGHCVTQKSCTRCTSGTEPQARNEK